MIRGAAAGRPDDRAAFAHRYAPVIRAYLGARWRSSLVGQEIDDAVQEVFVECYREGGALARVDERRGGGFRAFLYGVSRNVALRVESKQARRREHQAATTFEAGVGDPSEDRLSRIFDRAWAKGIMKEAARRQAEVAAERGDDAIRRVELLRLRFDEALPVRDIASAWGADPVHIHREYARARREFKQALMDVMAFHHPNDAVEAQSECARLLALLA